MFQREFLTALATCHTGTQDLFNIKRIENIGLVVPAEDKDDSTSKVIRSIGF